MNSTLYLNTASGPLSFQRLAVRIALSFLTILVVADSAGAQEKKKSTIRGAGLGALLGQAIGHDTESTIVGGVIGAGVGRVVGSEKEKAKSANQSQPASAASDPKPDQPVLPKPVEALYDSMWKLEEILPKDRVAPFFSKVITFRSDGTMQTLTTDPKGNVTVTEETFSAVEDTLVVNKADYTLQARFKLEADQLILSGNDFSAVLKRVPAVE